MGQRRNLKINYKHILLNENQNITYQNLCGAEGAVLRGIFVALSLYIIKEERSKINNLNFHPRKIEKEEQFKTKARGKMIKIRA